MGGLNLTVQVDAEEWAYCQRRLIYLETTLFQLVRERAAIQEWYDAEELAALRLPGLPATAKGVARRASLAGWRRQRLAPDGRARFFYHAASLPGRAFDALIAGILDLPAPGAPIECYPLRPTPPAPIAPELAPENVAPPWVLPLVRLVKSEAGDLARAWQALPSALPPGVAAPGIAEAAAMLVRLGLATG